MLLAAAALACVTAAGTHRLVRKGACEVGRPILTAGVAPGIVVPCRNSRSARAIAPAVAVAWVVSITTHVCSFAQRRSRNLTIAR